MVYDRMVKIGEVGCQSCKARHWNPGGQGRCRYVHCGLFEVINNLGTCSPCGENTYPANTAGRECIVKDPKCNSRSILTAAGKCVSCPDYKKADESGRKCIESKCLGDFEILNESADCQDCLDWEQPDEKKRKCMPSACRGSY